MKKINVLKKLIMFFAINLIGINIQAQTTLSSITESTSKSTSLPVTTIQVNTNTNTGNINSINSTTTSEAIPTPEAQGFIKYTISGKEVYIKKIDNVIIEYKPK